MNIGKYTDQAFKRLLEGIDVLDPMTTRSELQKLDDATFRRAWVLMVMDLWSSGDCSAADLARCLVTVRQWYDMMLLDEVERLEVARRWLSGYMARHKKFGVEHLKARALNEGICWDDVLAVKDRVGVDERVEEHAGNGTTRAVWYRQRNETRVRRQAVTAA